MDCVHQARIHTHCFPCLLQAQVDPLQVLACLAPPDAVQQAVKAQPSLVGSLKGGVSDLFEQAKRKLLKLSGGMGFEKKSVPYCCNATSCCYASLTQIQLRAHLWLWHQSHKFEYAWSLVITFTELSCVRLCEVNQLKMRKTISGPVLLLGFHRDRRDTPLPTTTAALRCGWVHL